MTTMTHAGRSQFRIMVALTGMGAAQTTFGPSAARHCAKKRLLAYGRQEAVP